LADRSGADPDDTVGVVNSAVYELRRAWRSGVAEEVESRFAALAKHYEHRLASLPLATAG
jgi:hypothetical protein